MPENHADEYIAIIEAAFDLAEEARSLRYAFSDLRHDVFRLHEDVSDCAVQMNEKDEDIEHFMNVVRS